MDWTFPAAASLAIFTATYVFISLRKIPVVNLDRPSAALFGGILMIVLELSRDRARIGFWEYFRVGLPVTAATTTAGFFILYLFHRAALV